MVVYNWFYLINAMYYTYYLTLYSVPYYLTTLLIISN